MKRFLCLSILLLTLCGTARAQFAANMGGNTSAQSQDTTVTAAESFKLITYFRALARKDSLNITRAWTGSIVLPGYMQAYNRQYWKAPIVLAGVGAGLYMGYRNNMKFQETGIEKYADRRNWFYIGAGLVYWGGMLDGIANYKSPKEVLPARAALYSALCPGLGQIYNGDYWKLPIVYGGLATCGYLWYFNNLQYTRYKNMYDHATATPSEYEGWMSPDDILWYRDTYRRYRDYSIISVAVMYALNILDANVFAHFQDFDVSDDLSLRLQPSVVSPLNIRFASASPNFSGVGLQMQLTF